MKRPNYWKIKIVRRTQRSPLLERVSRAADSHLHATLETPISFTLMVHHIVLYRLKPEVTPARVEEMMMNARMQLLKIPEVLSIKCGKRIDPEIDWPFFIAIDFESMDKYLHLPRRLDLREIRGGSDQAEHGRFAGARFRDGSGQRRAVFVIVARSFRVSAAVLKEQAARLPLQVIAIRRATRNHRSQCGSVICIRATP